MAKHRTREKSASDIEQNRESGSADWPIAVIANGPPPRIEDTQRALAPVLFDAVISSSDEATDLAIDEMLSVGIRPDQIVDYYIPTVAEMLGEGWIDDRTSFAEVTIGASRLQGVLKRIASQHEAMARTDLNTRSILLLVPSGDTHTLGSTVLVGQLRRLGFSVHFLLSPSLDRTLEVVAATDFDAIFVSTSRDERLESVATLLKTIEAALAKMPPVVIGGPTLSTMRDVIQRSGADYATNDLAEGLAFCCLTDSSADRETNSPQGA